MTIKDMEEAEKRIDAQCRVGNYSNPADVCQVMHLLDHYRQTHEDRVKAEAVKLMDSGRVRLCDKLGCKVVIVKAEEGNLCAEGHEYRWVDRRELNAANEQTQMLRGALEDFVEWHDQKLSLNEPYFTGGVEKARAVLKDAPPPPDRGDRADRAETLLLSLRQFFWEGLGGVFNRLEEMTALRRPEWLTEERGYPRDDIDFNEQVFKSGRVKKLAAALATVIEEIECECECEWSPNREVREVTCGVHQFTSPLWEVLHECWPKGKGDPRE